MWLQIVMCADAKIQGQISYRSRQPHACATPNFYTYAFSWLRLLRFPATVRRTTSRNIHYRNIV